MAALIKNTFLLEVINLRGIVFEDQVESVYITGTEGEFELLPFHYPLMAAIGESEVKILGHDSLPVRLGVVMFRENQCIIVAEMQADFKKMKKAWA